MEPVTDGPRPKVQPIMTSAATEMLALAADESSSTARLTPPPKDELREQGYYFDNQGYLRDTTHDKRAAETELNASPSSSELVAAVAVHVHSVLIHKFNFSCTLIPTLEEAVVPEARSPIYFSQDYDKKNKIMVNHQANQLKH